MKIGGGLSYVVGPMGAGKTYYGVRKIVNKLLAGGYVVTNVELLDGWAEKVAWHTCKTSKKKRAKLLDRIEAHYIFETDLQEAMRYRLPGKGESRGLFIWDEGHNDLSNRKWRDEGRQGVLEWATQLRKLGFAGFLLSQHQDNTEAQLRRVCNYIVRLQNQREQTRLLGMRITPWPLFLAVWHPSNVPLNAGRQVKPVQIERYMLGWHRHLYDTHGLFHGVSAVDAADRAIYLPVGGVRRVPELAPPAEDTTLADTA